MLRKLPIIAVFGQGTPARPERIALAKTVGARIAALGAHLLTGGGYGVMTAVAEGFVAVDERPGFSIGVVPRHPDGPFERPNETADGTPYPNPFVEIAIHTPLPPRVADWRTIPGRNHINVLSADAVIALPGGTGTDNELTMAAAYRGEAGRTPSARRGVLLGPRDEFSDRQRELFVHAETLDEAERHLRAALAPHGISI
jgi:uncharacterized protein (TIGR00725 family)